MPHLSPQKSLKATLKKAAISLLGVERVKALQPKRLDQIHLAWVDDAATTLTIVWRTFKASTPSLVEYRA
ncbi:MAG: fibronectin type III domain-containing protein, partial [Phormidesmis sp. CAN_BIN44]|nr:fibronectin type III domain-containing protein [Phormidesmis sp. CAN_BIN44]